MAHQKHKDYIQNMFDTVLLIFPLQVLMYIKLTSDHEVMCTLGQISCFTCKRALAIFTLTNYYAPEDTISDADVTLERGHKEE